MKSFTNYHLQFTIIAVIAAICFTACKKDEPEEPIPASFPKKQLIEEFTGQACGYCPYGMNCIHEYIANDTNWVLVLHHYGYQADHFTVAGSKTVTKAMKVDGAPSMTINRAKVNYGEGKGEVFHPGYLESTSKAQFDATTYASVKIENSYDANSRQLTVKVSGAICTTEHPELMLTVLVKESGMIDTQADYLYTFEGWKEFRHTNAVRAFLSDAQGDAISITDQRYSTEYTVTFEDEWVAENCMVVAFLTEDFRPVIQAEQKPVVAGTQGGANIRHGGITPVPVPDYYPEPGATKAPSDYSGAEADTMTYSLASYQNGENARYWTLMTYNSSHTVKVGSNTCIPFAYLYLITESSVSSIPTGTYELNMSGEPGSAFAGYRDDEDQQLGGSTFYYTGKSYFDQGYLDPKAQWLIADGSITVTETGWELIGHARNGAAIHLVGSTAIKHSSNAPAKLPRP